MSREGSSGESDEMRRLAYEVSESVEAIYQHLEEAYGVREQSSEWERVLSQPMSAMTVRDLLSVRDAILDIAPADAARWVRSVLERFEARLADDDRISADARVASESVRELSLFLSIVLIPLCGVCGDLSLSVRTTSEFVRRMKSEGYSHVPIASGGAEGEIRLSAIMLPLASVVVARSCLDR